MIQEIINNVVLAEETAAKQLEAALEEAKAKNLAADQDAALTTENALKEAKAARVAALAAAEASAQAEYDAILAQGEQEAAALKKSVKVAGIVKEIQTEFLKAAKANR